MAGWGEVTPDIVLTTLYVFLIIRLLTCPDASFKTPFFTFFIATGIYSVVTVVTYHIVAQFPFTERYWTIYLYKPAYYIIAFYALNAFGATGATLGKAIIAIHRYYVLRCKDFSEKKWSRSMIFQLMALQFLISLIPTVPVWTASYIYKNQEEMDQIVAITRINTLILKGFSIATYILYIISNGIFTILTSRELLKLRRMLMDNTDTSQTIMKQQRSMFIIVIVCSLSHLAKAAHQFVVAVSTYFGLDDLYNSTWPLYPLVNGPATYAAPLCLVLLSPTVRARLFGSRKIGQKSSNVTRRDC